MGKPQNVIVDESHHEIALLTLNSEDSGNALRFDMLYDLREALRQVTNSGVRALVLAGSGGNFSLGAERTDLAFFINASQDALTEATELLADVIQAVYEARIPTIAAVQGQAAGAGFSLALSCDLRIATESTRFNFAYAALGASPDGGMTWLLPRIVGWSRSQELLLEQPLIRAKKALIEGLVNEIVPSDELLHRALRIARLLASHPSHSTRTVKELLRHAEGASLGEQMRMENALFLRGLRTREMQERLDLEIGKGG